MNSLKSLEKKYDDELLVDFGNCQLEEGGIRYKVNDRLKYENARKMRKGYTEAEGVLWIYLRNNQLGEKFRRQHPVDNFVVDFICLKSKY